MIDLALEFAPPFTFGSAANNLAKGNLHTMMFLAGVDLTVVAGSTGQNKVEPHYQASHSLLGSDQFNYFGSPEKLLHVQPEELLVSP